MGAAPALYLNLGSLPPSLSLVLPEFVPPLRIGDRRPLSTTTCPKHPLLEAAGPSFGLQPHKFMTVSKMTLANQ